MKIEPKIEKLFFTNPPKIVSGEGFSVQVFLPFAIRYLDSGRALTIAAEPQIKERVGIAFLPRIFRVLTSRTWLQVTIEEPLYWDNSTDRPISPDHVIIERIESSLKRLRFAYTIKRVRNPAEGE